MNNNATATDSAGDLGGGGGIINLNVSQALGVANSGILTVSLSQVNDNSAAGTGGRILEDGTTPDFTFRPTGWPADLAAEPGDRQSGAEGGGIFARAGSPVTVKITAVVRNTPDNCFPPGSIPGCKN